MTPPPADDATVAAVFRAALSLGIATPADLVPWADGQVLAWPVPPAWVIDLSIGAAVPADQVCVALEDVAASADRTRTFHLLVGLVETTGVDEWDQVRRVAQWLLWAAAACGLVGDPLYTAADGIDDDVALCDLGYYGPSGRDRVRIEAEAFVGRHADPAARAWLPGVRVTFADAGRQGSASGPI